MPTPAAQATGGTITNDTITSLGSLQGGIFQLIAASGVINPKANGLYMVTKAGVAALTLAAPTAGPASQGGDDGVSITVMSSTAFQHTITATGLFIDGAGHVNVATFPTGAGASITLVAYNGKWVVESVQGVVMS